MLKFVRDYEGQLPPLNEPYGSVTQVESAPNQRLREGGVDQSSLGEYGIALLVVDDEDDQGKAPPLDDPRSLRRIVNVKDGVAASALCLATYGGHLDAVDQLVRLGANPSDWDSNRVYLRKLTATQGFHDIAARLEQAALGHKENSPGA